MFVDSAQPAPLRAPSVTQVQGRAPPAAPHSPPSHVLIASHGRCGSNWLLEIFDQSPATHCRTEVNSVDGSPFARLPASTIRDEASDSLLDAGWDDALRWAHERMGARDGRVTVPKTYLHGVSRALGLVALVQRHRGRRVLGSLMPALREQEWLLPWWLGDREKLREALPVIKLGLPAGWIPWVMRSRPDAHIIHLTRHPGGYLCSWMKRYLAHRDREATLLANRRRLAQVLHADPTWSDRFGDIAAMSVEEAEMWYWIYAAETTHSSPATCRRYDVLHYEDLVRDVAGEVRPIFERTGLGWNATIEARIRATVRVEPSQASRWREGIDSKQLAMVERLVGSSPLCDWW